MNFRLLGNVDAPAVMLIHGMATTAEKCYLDIARELAKSYRVILACLDGHDPYANSIFETIEQECEHIERYVNRRYGGRLFAVSGMSLGGTVTLELIRRGNIIIDRVHLDAAFCTSLGLMKTPYTLLFTKGIDYLKHGHKLPVIAVEKVFGKGNAGMTDLIYRGIEEETIKNVCNEVYSYRPSRELKDYTGAVQYWCGSDETYPKRSARALEKYLPDMRVRVFRGFGHGQMLRSRKRAYLRELKKFLTEQPEGCTE